MKLTSVSITVFSLAALLASCKDIAFNNPLDPNASKEVVQIIRVLETPLSGKGDLAFDGEKFWKISVYGDLTAIDRESGAIIRTYSAEPGTGIVFFRDELYLCGGEGGNIIYVVDPLSGDILDRISTTGIFPGYLAVYNNQLIIYDVRSAGIFEYDRETGAAVRLFEISGMNIGGIEMYKGGLLISDMNTDTIYRFSLTGAVMDVFSSPAAGISGLTVDNADYIYLFTLDGKIYKVSLP
jgi:hypothetical protein